MAQEAPLEQKEPAKPLSSADGQKKQAEDKDVEDVLLPVSVEVEEKGNDPAKVMAESGQTDPGPTDKQEEAGLSTWTKVGLGVGAAVAVGVAFALGGSSSDSPSFPSQENLVGTWRAQATRTDGSDSYTGVYTLFSGGAHTYDIYVASDGRKRGNGNWYQPPETYSLILRNDTGSLYQGEFSGDNFSTITLLTNDGRWRLTLTKM